MSQLLKSQDRATNNPGAQSQLGPEEILLLISREPEKTRARLEGLRQTREAEAHERITRGAAQTLLTANARFRRAERVAYPTEATRLRGEAEARLKHLQDVPADIWPWAAQASRVRDSEVLMVAKSVPVFEGLRITKPSELNPNLTQSAELGRVKEGQVGVRNPFDPRWRALTGPIGGQEPEQSWDAHRAVGGCVSDCTPSEGTIWLGPHTPYKRTPHSATSRAYATCAPIGPTRRRQTPQCGHKYPIGPILGDTLVLCGC